MAHILIADDNHFLLSMVEQAIRLAGHTTALAKNGADALDLASVGGVDLVLLDIEMPELNGIAVCKVIKANPASARIPVVMMTGSSSKAFVREAMAAGALDILKKPFGVQELLAVIAARLPESKARK